MKKLLIIILTVINITIICSALDFSMQFPGQVYINESFKVKIISESTDIYDVKVFIQSDKIISQTYNEYWKSSNYYLNSAFPKIKEYEIKPIQLSSNSQFCIRLRKPDQSKYEEQCKPINILERSQENESPIILSSKKEQIIFVSNRQKTMIFAFISFLILSFLIVILLIFKKI